MGAPFKPTGNERVPLASDWLKTLNRSKRDLKRREAHWKQPELDTIMERVPAVTATKPIKDVAKMMYVEGVRRVPITTPDGKLVGEVRGMDVLDFLGGGEKHNMIKSKFNGSIEKAINGPIRALMGKSPCTVKEGASVSDAIKAMQEKGVGAVFITDKAGKLLGRITERTFVNLMADASIQFRVSDLMQKEPITIYPAFNLADVARIMVKQRLRRLPVMEKDRLVGIVTYMDILKFLGAGENIGAMESTAVETVMERNPVTLSPEDTMTDFCALVRKTGHGGFPVVSDGRVVGVITERDLVEAIRIK